MDKDIAHEQREANPEQETTRSPGESGEVVSFGGGLLPKETNAESRPGWFKVAGFEVGPVFVSGKSETLGASFSLGLDFSCDEISNPLLWRACLAEMLGLIAFLFFTITNVIFHPAFGAAAKAEAIEALKADETGAGASVQVASGFDGGTHLMIAFTFGITIFLLVNALAPVSGANLNPAVTFGLMLTRKVTVLRGVLYIGFQLAGAVLGTLLVKMLSPTTFLDLGGGVNGSEEFSNETQLGVEIIGTALLVFVVYSVVDPERASDNVSIAALGPLSIGLAVFVAHTALIPITGCGINPARSFGPAVATGTWDGQWIFWAGPMIGAAIAAVLYEIVFKGRRAFENKWS